MTVERKSVITKPYTSTLCKSNRPTLPQLARQNINVPAHFHQNPWTFE